MTETALVYNPSPRSDGLELPVQRSHLTHRYSSFMILLEKFIIYRILLVSKFLSPDMCSFHLLYLFGFLAMSLNSFLVVEKFVYKCIKL